MSSALSEMTRRAEKKTPNTSPVDMRRVAAIVLGGGQGTRLFPLTSTRCKPAISFGGHNRLIDISIINAIHSYCDKIYIITQFLSTSLHKHICRTYQGNSAFSNGFLDILSAEQRPSHDEWFQGTADAVRQNLYYLKEAPVDYFLILSGDQVYSMDFREMVAFANNMNADVVVGALPVNLENAKRMGILRIDQNSNAVTDFVEKPQQTEILDTLKLSRAFRNRLEIDESEKKFYLGSMGIYLFKRQALIDLLTSDPREDFGKHLLPTKVSQGGAYAYIHDGYWEDIGTIKTFYEANLALTYPSAPLNYYNEAYPFIRNFSQLPGAKIINCMINNSIICEGSIVEAEEVTHSILGPRSVIKKGAVIRHSYIMGNDFYHPPSVDSRFPEKLHIGENTIIQKAIVDKDVYIGKGVHLVNKANLTNYDSDKVYIREGIIVVPRGAYIPDGFNL